MIKNPFSNEEPVVSTTPNNIQLTSLASTSLSSILLSPLSQFSTPPLLPSYKINNNLTIFSQNYEILMELLTAKNVENLQHHLQIDINANIIKNFLQLQSISKILNNRDILETASTIPFIISPAKESSFELNKKFKFNDNNNISTLLAILNINLSSLLGGNNKFKKLI